MANLEYGFNSTLSMDFLLLYKIIIKKPPSDLEGG